MMSSNDAMIADDVVLPKQQTLIELSASAKVLRSNCIKIKGSRSGQRLSSFKGRGMEFDEARPYQPGDDIRSIDWKVTARTQKTHTKVFRQERERPVHFWIDNRQNMQFATQCCYKSVMAAKVASLLAWHTQSHSDRVGGMVFSEASHQEFRPKMGRSSVLRLIHLLSQHSNAEQEESSLQALEHALYRLGQVAKPGALLYLISDFSDFSEAHFTLFNKLSRHNDVALIHIYDAIEKALPPSGFYQLYSQAKQWGIQTTKQKTRDSYQQHFKEKQQQLENLCFKHRMRYLSLATSDNPIDRLRQWLK